MFAKTLLIIAVLTLLHGSSACLTNLSTDDPLTTRCSTYSRVLDIRAYVASYPLVLEIQDLICLLKQTSRTSKHLASQKAPFHKTCVLVSHPSSLTASLPSYPLDLSLT